MKPYSILFILALVLAAALGAGCTGSESTGTQNQSATTPTVTPAQVAASPVSSEALVAFVERAYEYANIHGREAALQEFNDPSGRFIDGELYIFAYDSNGTTLALPFQPEVVGTDRWNITDANGTAYIQEAFAVAQDGGGFIRYLYADPADNFTVKQKLSYVMMVDGGWLIGAGIYDPQDGSPTVKAGTDSLLRESLKTFVGEAIAYAGTVGKEEALQEFNDKNGTFVRGDLYIYAFDYNGTTLALPFQPQLIGTDLSGLQDPFGVNYTRVEILLAQHGGGFIFYHYADPSQNMTVEPKMSYVQKVDDTWWLGAGVYVNGTDASGSS